MFQSASLHRGTGAFSARSSRMDRSRSRHSLAPAAPSCVSRRRTMLRCERSGRKKNPLQCRIFNTLSPGQTPEAGQSPPLKRVGRPPRAERADYRAYPKMPCGTAFPGRLAQDGLGRPSHGGASLIPRSFRTASETERPIFPFPTQRAAGSRRKTASPRPSSVGTP
jgi:hypothetical protein